MRGFLRAVRLRSSVKHISPSARLHVSGVKVAQLSVLPEHEEHPGGGNHICLSDLLRCHTSDLTPAANTDSIFTYIQRG